ncbi:MAG: TonB-dependent receptor [Candidatus Margulisiibacteriota bacterium]
MKRFAALVFLALMVVPAVSLEPEVYYGELVVVTALKRPVPLSRLMENISIIDSKEIELSGAKNAADILKNRSIVYVKSMGDLSGMSSLKIKSASSEQVLVLLDGARLNSSLLGMADLNNIPASSIERIEIVADPMSGIWGADAMGGVVNIITKRSQDKPLHVSVSAGSFGQVDSFIAASAKSGPFNYYLSYGYLKSNGWRVNSDYSGGNLSLDINAGETASLNYSVSNSQRGNPGVPSSDTDPSSASTPNDRQSDLISKLLVKLDPGAGKEGFPVINISQLEWQQKSHYADWFVPTVFYDDTYLSRISQAELYTTISAPAGSKLTGGVEFRRNLGESSKTPNHAIDNGAVYVNGQTREGLPAAISYGLRYDMNSSFGNVLTPKVGLIMGAGKDTTFKINLATAFRAPTINELYWNDPSFFTFGNPNLKPENSNSAGITLEQKLLGFQADFNYYYTRIRDMIKWSQTGLMSWQPVNLDSARVEGFQLGLRRELLEGLQFSAGWNNEVCADESTQKILTYSPRNKINAALEYSAGGFCARAAYRFVSDVYTNAANSASIPAYQTVDLGLSKKLFGAAVSLTVENLFDESYCESVGTSPVDWKERGYPMPGRRISAGIKI